MKQWKKFSKRGLAMMLVLVLCVSMLGTTAFAEEDPAEESTVVESTDVDVNDVVTDDETKDDVDDDETETDVDDDETEDDVDDDETETDVDDDETKDDVDDDETETDVDDDETETDVDDDEPEVVPAPVLTPAKTAEEPSDEENIMTLADEVEPTSAEKLQTAAVAGGSYTLTENVTASITVPKGVDFKLDLGSYTLTNEAGKDTITNNGTLTIIGSGTVDNVSHGKAALVNDGTVEVTGGTLTRSQETGVSNSVSGGNSWYVVVNSGTMTFDGDVTVRSTGKFSSLVRNLGDLTINGGTFSNGNTAIKNESGTLTVNGGTLTSTDTGYSLVNYGTAELNGGDYRGSTGYALFNGATSSSSPVGKVTISGGTFAAGDAEKIAAYLAPTVVQGENGEVVARTEDADDAVAKIGSDVYASLQEAIDAAEAGDTVTLVKDATEKGVLTIAKVKKVTLDLNGKQLTLDSQGNESAVFVYGELTIEDSGENGVLSHNGNYGLRLQGGELVVNGGLIEGTATINIAIGINNTDTEASACTINGGELRANSNVIFWSQKDSVLTLNGGKLVGYGGVEMRSGTLEIPEESTVEITATGFGGGFSYLPQSGSNIFGAAIAVDHYERVMVNIAGGTFTGYYALLDLYTSSQWNSEQNEIKVTGGTFVADTNMVKGDYGTAITESAQAVYTTTESTISVSGGTFTTDVSEYCVAGTEWDKDTQEIVAATGEDYVAQVGNVSYKTLQKAIDAAQNGQTITLLADVTESVTVAKGQNITLDLNGKKLEGSKGHTVTNNGTLTIRDDGGEGKIVGMNIDDKPYSAVVNEHGATCTIASGMITRAPYLDGAEQNDVKTNSNYTVQNKGKMYITGGQIVNNSSKSSMVVNLNNQGSGKYGQNKDVYMEISGGELRQDTYTALKNDPGSEMVIKGDASIVNNEAGSYVTQFYGDVKIQGGSFKGGQIWLCSHADAGGNYPTTVEITAGKIDVAKILAIYGYCTVVPTGDVKVELTISGEANITCPDWSECEYDRGSGKVVVTENSAKSDISISGGTFSTDVSEYCAEGYLSVENSDGTYGVVTETPVTGVTLDQAALSLVTNGTRTATLTATVTPENTTDDTTVTWTSSNTAVATVENGVVTAVGNGTATITATVGSFSASCTVTVTTRSTSGTGGGGGSSSTVTPPIVEIEDPDVPLAELPLPFLDIENGQWYREAVVYAYSHNLMVGVASTTFAPNMKTTRGMIVAMLYRLEEEPETSGASFNDVLEGKWYKEAVDWAAATGVASGYGNGRFGPDDSLNREQLVTIIFRYAAMKGCDVSARADLSQFTDVGKVSAYAADAMSWAVAVGLVQGTSATTLSPTGNATRAQVAAIMMRLCEDILPEA